MFSQWKLNQYAANRKRRTLPKYLKLWINKLHFGSNVAEEMKMFSLTRNKGWRYEYSEEVPGNHVKLSYPFAATLLSLTERNSCHPFIVLSASLKCGRRNENFALQKTQRKSRQTDFIYRSLMINIQVIIILKLLDFQDKTQSVCEFSYNSPGNPVYNTIKKYKVMSRITHIKYYKLMTYLKTHAFIRICLGPLDI